MIDFGSIIGAGASVASAVGGLLTGGKKGADISEGTDALWGAYDQTAQAFKRAQEAYMAGYDTARADLTSNLGAAKAGLEPYAEGGLRGFNALANVLAPDKMTAVDMISGLPPGVGADLMNYLTKTPVYQFPFQEGLNALDRSAASRGMLLSGAQTKAAQQYGQNFALSNALNPAMANYQNYLKNIAGLGGVGYEASSRQGNWQMQTGNALADKAMQHAANMGTSNFQLAQLQNALAGNIASSYTQQGLLNQAASNRYGNALGSLIGTGVEAARDIWNAGPWSQIGQGGNSWSVPSSNVFGGGYRIL